MNLVWPTGRKEITILREDLWVLATINRTLDIHFHSDHYNYQRISGQISHQTHRSSASDEAYGNDCISSLVYTGSFITMRYITWQGTASQHTPNTTHFHEAKNTLDLWVNRGNEPVGPCQSYNELLLCLTWSIRWWPLWILEVLRILLECWNSEITMLG